ncbi:hypothetical protein KDA_02010 [Dictyobacter alpinus]|uniref:Serine aminopeptidase S33 domain-containing protein n=1 Tax=Dictyobacter alpinus TaxID=2014873 RepID=A0A402B076_9CHLR|nr:alpha/beta fold hydrolase [Dictyobacter alpinus]GCE24717.1 hypothetical protein KDA_02010 [Dictyobacter alpinus]
MKSPRLLSFLFILLFLAACGSEAPAKPTTVATPQATPTPAITPTATIPQVSSHLVHFKTSDNVQLAGSLYGSGKAFVICSHELSTDKKIWENSGVPQRLASLGYQVLAYDFRGNGDSEGTSDITILDTDLRAAIAFVKKQGATKIVLLGSSMGGTASLKVAANTNVAAVITLSSPEMFPTNVTDDDVKAIKAPKLFVNSKFDTYSEDTIHMHSIAKDPKELQMYEGNLHGTAIFDSDNGDKLTQLILKFVTHYAPVH